MMYRDSSTDTYHDSDDELPFELPFDMDSWSESEVGLNCSRPGNPLPKLLNEDLINNCSGYPDTENISNSSLLKQKRVRGESLDGHYLNQLTSSGERWQFQKCYLPHFLPPESNMFSQSYIVPVTDPTLEFAHDEKIIETFKELDLLEDQSSVLNQILTNGNNGGCGEQGDHRSKKIRIGSQNNLLKSVENIDIVTHKRKKCQQYDDEFSHFTNWEL